MHEASLQGWKPTAKGNLRKGNGLPVGAWDGCVLVDYFLVRKRLGALIKLTGQFKTRLSGNRTEVNRY
jgi:hypothetical protein